MGTLFKIVIVTMLTVQGLVNCKSNYYSKTTVTQNEQRVLEKKAGKETSRQELKVSQWSSPRQCLPLWTQPDYSIILLICANKNNDNLFSKSTEGTLQLINTNHWALWEALPENGTQIVSQMSSPSSAALTPPPSMPPHLKGGKKMSGQRLNWRIFQPEGKKNFSGVKWQGEEEKISLQ